MQKVKYIMLNLDAVVNCDTNPCKNGGTCSIDQNALVQCKCTKGWFGQYCNISSVETGKIIAAMDDKIKAIKPGIPLSNDMIEDLKVFQNILSSKPELATPGLTTKVSKMAKQQIELIAAGKVGPNPNMLNLLDFSLDLTLYFLFTNIIIGEITQQTQVTIKLRI